VGNFFYVWQARRLAQETGREDVTALRYGINTVSLFARGGQLQDISSLMANGTGSIVAAVFGSVFPTTIFMGHPGWKRLGARSGYSALNGIFIALLCLTGTIQAVLGPI
jgi:hypothetical protein